MKTTPQLQASSNEDLLQNFATAWSEPDSDDRTYILEAIRDELDRRAPTTRTNEEQVEDLAALQFLVVEVQTITGITWHPKAKAGKDHLLELAFRRGRLKAEAEVRQSILTMARQGSTPAQKTFTELVNKRERQERRA